MKNIGYAVLAASTILLLAISVPVSRPIYAQSEDSEVGGGSSSGGQQDSGAGGGSSSSQQDNSNSGNDLAGKVIVKGGCYLLTKLPQCLALNAQAGN